jgi:penicillin-binding protein 1C
MKKRKFIKGILGLAIVILLSLWWFSLPKDLFKAPLSTVVWSADHRLLGARVASDQQWRFPAQDSVSQKFKDCIIYFEDEYFEYHFGFNPVSMAKALWQNITTDSKRGGSTLTQQVVRLSRGNRQRTYAEKLKELFLSIRLEATFSKDDILNFYATYAPFGGNIVGLETAAWRYYNLPSKDLSWAQTAALAVLPNAPSLVFPGKNQSVLKAKRDRLLLKLLNNAVIDSTTYKLSLLEPLPGKAFELPDITPHLTEHIRQAQKSGQVHTTIDYRLQQRVNSIVERYLNTLKSNQIFNASVLVADINTGKVIAYSGNSNDKNAAFHYVNMVTSPRSTGSLLKPILYAGMLNEGELLPQQLLKDTPGQFGNYQPQNFTKDFSGAVPADIFIQKSLNVPAVRLLKDYGVERFLNKLQKLKLEGVNRSADYYGLPLILGGAESSLWELTRMYAYLGHTLKHMDSTAFSFHYQKSKDVKADWSPETEVLRPSSIFLMLEAMKGLERPGLDAGWKSYASSQDIAWKTGTSYGFKDAWSIGLNHNYAVGIWVGNADGSGRPQLVGVNLAAPLMFSVFDVLPKTKSWFETPVFDMKPVEVCEKSGFLKSLHCPVSKTIEVPQTMVNLKPCAYHVLKSVSEDENYQLHQKCSPRLEVVTKPWFILPPVMEYYYKKEHPEYKILPDFHASCNTKKTNTLAFIYPTANQDIIVPKTLDGKTSKIVLKAAYNKEKMLYWHLNDVYIGSTQYFHNKEIQPAPGDYILTIVNEDGQQLQQKFKVSYTE